MGLLQNEPLEVKEAEFFEKNQITVVIRLAVKAKGRRGEKVDTKNLPLYT